MTPPPDGYWFRSAKFEIEPGEDVEINPRIYGRQLTVWLKARLDEAGYAVEIVNEDWGRCLICQNEPFLLWVGCANVYDYDSAQPGDGPPSKDQITWHCFATAEVFFWKRLFQTIDTGPAIAKLHADLGTILRADPEIVLVDEP